MTFPPTPWEKALDKLVAVHRDWCNYCQGDAVACSNAPVGGCSLRDYLIALDEVPSEKGTSVPPPKIAATELGWQCPGCKRCYSPGKWQCDYCVPSLKDRVRSG